MTDNKQDIYFYLEKTFSQNPSDIAHLLKYLYFSNIRFDTKMKEEYDATGGIRLFVRLYLLFVIGGMKSVFRG